MAGDKYCRTVAVTDYIEFEISEVPKENEKFLYRRMSQKNTQSLAGYMNGSNSLY